MQRLSEREYYHRVGRPFSRVVSFTVFEGERGKEREETGRRTDKEDERKNERTKENENVMEKEW